MWQRVAFFADPPDRLSLSYHLFQQSIQHLNSWKETSRFIGGTPWWVLAFVLSFAVRVAAQLRSPAKERTSFIFVKPLPTTTITEQTVSATPQP
jgi:hypothetical protein